MGEDRHVWHQGIYENFVNFPLNFAVNLKLLLKKLSEPQVHPSSRFTSSDWLPLTYAGKGLCSEISKLPAARLVSEWGIGGTSWKILCRCPGLVSLLPNPRTRAGA